MSQGQIIIVPACEAGRGGGHLSRCMSIVGGLRSLEREAWLFVPSAGRDLESFFSAANFNPFWKITENDLQRICERKVEFIITDRFRITQDELENWKKIAPVAGIDEGSSFRDSFDFLIDILVPQNIGRPKANINSPSLLYLPQKLHPRKFDHEIEEIEHHYGKLDKLKILLTFGHEDSAGLGKAIAEYLGENGENMEVTLLCGALSNAEEREKIDNVNVIETIPQLAQRLGEYDLVITHYGITAYEALHAGTPVLLANPTPYHEKLAKAAGFITITKYIAQSRQGAENAEIFIKGKIPYFSSASFASPRPRAKSSSIITLKDKCNKLALKFGFDKENEDLSTFVNRLSPQVNKNCPVCGEKSPQKSVFRFTDRTYRRCTKCGIIFMDRTCPPTIEYEKEYFFEFYQKQYGKTYIEDFPNLIVMAKRRLKIIKSLKSSPDHLNQAVSHEAQSSQRGKRKLLLDIGCAYGPFLAAAAEEGFSPAGIDPAQDAVAYVQKELKFLAVQGLFPNCEIPDPYAPPPEPYSLPDNTSAPVRYDVVTLWYVLEHFTDCLETLKKIKSLLKPGGILAFSIPSFSGISARASLENFLSKSPGDHYTVWSPKTCKTALALAGFKVKKISVTGHHPERFPFFGKAAQTPKSPLYKLLLAVSKTFRLGDTFEVYAVNE